MLTIARATALLLFLVAAACGGGGGPTGGGSGQPAGSIKVEMSEFKFNPSAISTKSGKVTFYLVNSGTVAHDLVIETPAKSRVAASDLVQPGNTSVFTVSSLAPGSYLFVCDQPGHESAGMKGTLTVSATS